LSHFPIETHAAQGSLGFSHLSASTGKPGSRRPQHGIIEAGTLVGHLGLIYNRPRDATVMSRAGAVVWKFITKEFQQQGGITPIVSMQLQVKRMIATTLHFYTRQL
jgi:hypothetical protein